MDLVNLSRDVTLQAEVNQAIAAINPSKANLEQAFVKSLQKGRWQISDLVKMPASLLQATRQLECRGLHWQCDR